MRPIIPIIDEVTGVDFTSTSVVVELKPWGNDAGKIICSRLNSTHRYRANSDIDWTVCYHIYANSKLIGKINDDQINTTKATFVDAY
jgi:hypothetical protein